LAIVSESTYRSGNETEMRRSSIVIAVMWAVLSFMSDCAFDLLALHQFELRATTLVGARGSIVVKALCYKPAGRGFETR
jgi:hypothetical protein